MKKACASLCFLILTQLQGWSQNFSVSDLSQAALVKAKDLDAGDYDNDGDLDLLACWFDTSNSVWKAEVLRNTSTPGVISFTTTGIIITDVSGFSRWIDLNSDGKLDILASGFDGTANFLRVYVNDSGSFSDMLPVSNDLATSIDWGDVDADGDNDLLITNGAGSVLLTRTDVETFSQSVANVFSVNSILADYDLDNDLDVIGDGIYSNRGDEFIETHALFPTANGYTNMGRLYATDLDGDGDRDMIRGEKISARGSIDYFAVAYFNVNNIFTREVIETIDDFSGGPIYPLGAVDFDNNGDVDIAYSTNANTENYFIRFREVKSQRVTTFGLPANSRFHNLGGHVIADFNGDQKLDIITTGSYINTVNSETVEYARAYKNATVASNAKPSIPVNLKTIIQSTSVALSWDRSSDTETPGASMEYNFYLRQGLDTLISSYATKSGKPRINSIKGSFEANRFYIPALLNNGSYQWAVQAKDKAGNYSAFSAESNFEFSNGKSDVNHFSSLTDQQVNYDRASDQFVLVGVQNGNIYGVLLDGKFGERKSSLKKLNQFSSACHSPKVTVDSTGNYLVTWIGDSTASPQVMWGKFVKNDLSFTQPNEWRASEKVFYDPSVNWIISHDARYNPLRNSFDLAWIFSGDIAGASVRRVTMQNNVVKRDPIKNINWTYKSGVLHGARGHLHISMDSDPVAGRSMAVYSYEDERAELGITSLGKIYFQELDQNLVAVKDSVMATTFTLGDSPHVLYNPYLGNFMAIWNAHFLHQASPLPQDGDIESRDVAAALLTFTPAGTLSTYIFPSTISKAQQQGGEGGTLDPDVSFNYKRNEFLVSWSNTNSNKIYGQRINPIDKTTVTADEFVLKESVSEFPGTIFSDKWNHFLMACMLNGEGSTSLVKIPKDQAPKVTSLSSVKGYAGDKIIITGSNFGKTPFLNVVYFGSIKAEVDPVFWDQTKIQVTVPTGLTLVKVPITVTYDDQVSNATILFENITVSSLTAVVPLEGKEGDLITITGINFPTDKTNFKVMFGSTEAELDDITNNTVSEIKVKVPVAAKRGSQKISVVIQDITNEFAGGDFRVIRVPAISSVDPDDEDQEKFIAFRNIRVTGNNLSEQSGDLTIKLNDNIIPPGNISVATPTELVFRIPMGLRGEHELSVSSVDGEVLYPEKFTIFLGSAVEKKSETTEIKFTKTNDIVNLFVEVLSRRTVQELKFWSKGISAQDTEWKSQTLTGLFDNSRVDFVITEDEFTDDPLGLDAYFEVLDSSSLVEVSSSFKVFRNYLASGETRTIPDLNFGGDVSDYNIISIPYELSPNKINTVFKSILDNYGYDKSKWRIAHYANDGTASAEYKEYLSGLDQIDPGQGYWIIVRNQQDITFEKGNTVNTNGGPFEIELHPGWNQIGNPYDFNVSWSDVLEFNSDKGDTLAQIESYKTFKAGAFVNINTIDRFRGGFVRYNGTKAVKLKIPFTKNASINNGRSASGKSFASDLNAKEWRIALDLSSGEIKNKISSFGMHPKGTDGEDERDEHRLPAFTQSLDVAFPHSLSTSVVATNEYHTWEFDVFNTTGSKEITLDWDNTSFGDNDRELFLHDRAGERLVNMRGQSSYTFTYQKGHHFNIYFGDRSYIEDQSRPGIIVLSDAYPNPMKGTTTIPFTVVQDQTHVQLSIYNLQGKEITTLVNNKLPAGFYELEWDGRSAAGEQLSSGVVMYRLHTSQPGSASRSIVKKLMIAP